MSLIIITMNRCDELRKTLIDLKQQDTDFELIVVDNGSKDDITENSSRILAGGSGDRIVIQ